MGRGVRHWRHDAHQLRGGTTAAHAAPPADGHGCAQPAQWRCGAALGHSPATGAATGVAAARAAAAVECVDLDKCARGSSPGDRALARAQARRAGYAI